MTTHAIYCNGPVRTDDGWECDCGVAEQRRHQPVGQDAPDAIDARLDQR